MLGGLASHGPLFVALAALAFSPQELLRARGPGGEQVWWNPRDGLVVLGWDVPGGAVRFGRAAHPRFDGAGRLWAERSIDDGHEVLGYEALVLERGTRAPRLAGQDESPPPRAAERPTGALPAAGAAIRVCLDPGHGGVDPGAIGFGHKESDVVLDVALRLRELLIADSLDSSGGGAWEVLMTREDDSTVSLLERVSVANAWAAQRFVSIHANGFGSSAANGTETYSYQEGTTGAHLRDRVHEEMLVAWGLTDRGTKTAGFYVLVNTSMPAVLSEAGFMTSPIDIQKLADPDARQELALAHLFGLQRHFGLAPHEPAPSGFAGTLKGVLYDASIGIDARIPGGTVALADGTFALSSATGYYEFPLPAGTYALAGTAAGFHAAHSFETITSGDVWESLGLAPGPVPGLSFHPPFPAPGAAVSLAAVGDPGSSVWLFSSLAPGLPLLWAGALGTVWPDVHSLLLLALGSVPPGGVIDISFQAPALPGLRLHAQALVTSSSSLRLSSGAAFEVQ